MSNIVTISKNYTKVKPEDIAFPRYGFSIGKFGKSEVEESAGKLVKFFQDRGTGWAAFTFHELHVYYTNKGWKPEEMLYGLLGAWMDDGSWMVVESVAYVVHWCNFLTVTENFIERIKENVTSHKIAHS